MLKKGQSGNPGGRPKGSSLTAQLRVLLDKEVTGKDGTVNAFADLVVEGLVKNAEKGDVKAIADIFNRVDGPVP